MDVCGSFPLDVCEDMMKMEMFLSSFPKLAMVTSGQQLGGGLYLFVCVCVFMLRRRWQSFLYAFQFGLIFWIFIKFRTLLTGRAFSFLHLWHHPSILIFCSPLRWTFHLHSQIHLLFRRPYKIDEVGASLVALVKNLPASAEDTGSIPDPGRSQREKKKKRMLIFL